MVRLTTCADGFEARLVAARLGSEGVVWSLRGGHDGPLAFGTVDVLVDADDLEVAQEVLGLEVAVLDRGRGRRKFRRLRGSALEGLLPQRPAPLSE